MYRLTKPRSSSKGLRGRLSEVDKKAVLSFHWFENTLIAESIEKVSACRDSAGFRTIIIGILMIYYVERCAYRCVNH